FSLQFSSTLCTPFPYTERGRRIFLPDPTAQLYLVLQLNLKIVLCLAVYYIVSSALAGNNIKLNGLNGHALMSGLVSLQRLVQNIFGDQILSVKLEMNLSLGLRCLLCSSSLGWSCLCRLLSGLSCGCLGCSARYRCFP